MTDYRSSLLLLISFLSGCDALVHNQPGHIPSISTLKLESIAQRRYPSGYHSGNPSMHSFVHSSGYSSSTSLHALAAMPILNIHTFTLFGRSPYYEINRIIDIMVVGSVKRKISVVLHAIAAVILFQFIRTRVIKGIPKLFRFFSSIFTKVKTRKESQTNIIIEDVTLKESNNTINISSESDDSFVVREDKKLTERGIDLEQQNNNTQMLNVAKKRVIDTFQAQDKAVKAATIKMIDAVKPGGQMKDIMSLGGSLQGQKVPEKAEENNSDKQIKEDVIILIKENNDSILYGTDITTEIEDELTLSESENEIHILDVPEKVSLKVDEVTEDDRILIIPNALGLSLEPFSAENMVSFPVISDEEKDSSLMGGMGALGGVEVKSEVKKGDRTLHELAEQLVAEEELIRILADQLHKLATDQAEEEVAAITVAAAVARARAVEEGHIIAAAAAIALKAHEVTEEEQRRVAMKEGIHIITPYSPPKTDTQEAQEVEIKEGIFKSPINSEQIGAIFAGLLVVAPIFMQVFRPK